VTANALPRGHPERSEASAGAVFIYAARRHWLGPLSLSYFGRRMESVEARILEWCARLLACRSTTAEGTGEIVRLCARELLRPHAIESRLIESRTEGSSQVNLVCRVGGREHDCAPLVFNTHLDTVPPGDAGLWTECPDGPFSATLKGDRIYGLGAADTKLDFVAKAFALIECGTPRRDVYLVATFGEEHGLVGAKEIAAAGILPRGALAFIGEPSHLQVITAHKGLMVFDLELGFHRDQLRSAGTQAYRVTFEGRAAHSSTPALGLNAIRVALETASHKDFAVASIDGGDAVNKVPARCTIIIDREPPETIANTVRIEPNNQGHNGFIPADAFSALYAFVRALTEFSDHAGRPEPDYTPPTLTSNPGVIRSGEESIVLEFELRPPPSLPLDEVREGVRQIGAVVSARWPNLRVTLAERRANPGFRSGLEGETVELAMAALASAGLPLESGVKAGCTEAGVYAASGLRPVVFGPGPSTGVIHAPNEYNLLSDVEGALRFYRQLLRL
jgi:acetylornithine deacetylase/succinyl-diaminopimelate desuccinylase-like protein